MVNDEVYNDETLGGTNLFFSSRENARRLLKLLTLFFFGQMNVGG